MKHLILTNKIVALLLTMVMLFSLASGVAAEKFDVTSYVNSFTGKAYTENSFYGNGTIIIILSHEKSIVWREYTEADFPELELEIVETLDPTADDEGRKNNPQYRGFVHVTLKNKSNEAVIEAIEFLYKRCENNPDIEYGEGDIYQAFPMSKTYYDTYEPTPDISESVSFGDVNGDYIINLSDVAAMLKYIAKWDNIRISLEATDLNNDGKITLVDATLLLKMLAKWGNI